MHHGGSAWKGRSYCPKCRQQLKWYELFPLVSFILQWARCRSCKQKIDWQYPLVELAAGILFVLSWNLDFGFWNLIQWYLLSVLIVLFVYDLRYGLVPDKVVLPAIGVALIFNIVVQPSLLVVGYLLLAVLVGALFFAVQYLYSKGRWLGSGDIRIGALMGAMLGWPLLVEGLTVSYIIGGAVGVLLLIAGKKRFGQTLPLGTFLTLGTAIVFLYGEQIWNWYWY